MCSNVHRMYRTVAYTHLILKRCLVRPIRQKSPLRHTTQSIHVLYAWKFASSRRVNGAAYISERQIKEVNS